MAVLVEGEKPKFQWVRSIYGRGADAKERYHHIPSEGMNQHIAAWHKKQKQSIPKNATPSRIITCPRVAWLQVHGVPKTRDMGWGTEQRMLLGRELENLFAKQLENQGVLVAHWKDDERQTYLHVPGQDIKPVDRLTMGEGLERKNGVPDYLLKVDDGEKVVIAVSDAKTSRSDSFGYVPLSEPEIWDEWGWYKYRLQLTDYFMLCHENKAFFEEHNLPLPEVCHLFSYALDDGVVRREVTWKPTNSDMELVRKYTRRFNQAVASEQCPPCLCGESKDGFDIKFCAYGIAEKGAKIATHCCGDDLIKLAKPVNT